MSKFYLLTHIPTRFLRRDFSGTKIPGDILNEAVALGDIPSSVAFAEVNIKDNEVLLQASLQKIASGWSQHHHQIFTVITSPCSIENGMLGKSSCLTPNDDMFMAGLRVCVENILLNNSYSV